MSPKSNKSLEGRINERASTDLIITATKCAELEDISYAEYIRQAVREKNERTLKKHKGKE